MYLCPSYKHLRAAKNKNKDKNNGGNFYPEKINLIDDEKIAHIRAVRANTPHVVSVRSFVCQNQKDQPQNYCGELFDAQAKKKLCESNRTDYVFFYVDKSEQERSENKPKEGPVYFVVFARYSGTDTEIPEIAEEVKRTAKWLGIAGGVIQCYIFYYSTSFLCNTLDWGTYKEKFNQQCRDSNYSFQFRYIPPNEESRWLTINGGSPKFTIEVQKM